MTRPLPLIVLALLVGCGSAAPSRPDAAKRATAQDRAVKFAECIRNHGISDFPDPNAKGEFEYGASVTPAVFNRALRPCKDLQPPGSLSSKREPKEQSAALRFARCVRQNGVKDFPDPVNGEPVINTYEIPSSNAPGGMEILNAATSRCKTLLDRALAEK